MNLFVLFGLSHEEGPAIDPLWAVLFWLIFFVLLAGLATGVYFILPKKWRKRSLWYRLPLVMGILQVVLALLFLANDEEREGMFKLFYVLILNYPVELLGELPQVDRWLLSVAGPDWYNAVFAIVSVTFWMIMSCLIGLAIDYRRRRAGQVASGPSE